MCVCDLLFENNCREWAMVSYSSATAKFGIRLSVVKKDTGNTDTADWAKSGTKLNEVNKRACVAPINYNYHQKKKVIF
jgi:hypothetical protein